MQPSLFDAHDEAIVPLVGPDLTAVVHRGALAPDVADAALADLLAEVPWRQHHLTMFGRRIAVPRLECWMGDPDAAYAYSGLALDPVAWTPAVARLAGDARRDAAAALGRPIDRFNAALINRYRDGTDGVDWHADDEAELGARPFIVSVSLGASRRFQMRRRDDRSTRRDLWLHHGDLLVMADATQSAWLHRVPREHGAVGERVCLTLRHVESGHRPPLRSEP